MLRIKTIIILFCLIGYLSSAQSEADFPADLIREAQIDSCIITGDFSNYPEKYYFDKEGRITAHSVPTSFHLNADSVIHGVYLTTYYYDLKGRLSEKTVKADFEKDSRNIPERLSEKLVYDLEGNLITHLFYFSDLEKIVQYQYANKLLSSETSYVFNKPQGAKLPEVQIINRLYKGDEWLRYNDEGNIQDSIVTIVDSSKFKKTILYYNYQKYRLKKENPEVFIYHYNNQWLLEKIITIYDSSRSTDKFYRTENGLLERIEHSGNEPYELNFEYY